jgi:catechol 2,3-dioxygenase-like lactoylglutathione lyase family enzyme
MSSLKKIMPVLRVRDLAEAIDWYTRLLHWPVEKAVAGNEMIYFLDI